MYINEGYICLPGVNKHARMGGTDPTVATSANVSTGGCVTAAVPVFVQPEPTVSQKLFCLIPSKV